MAYDKRLITVLQEVYSSQDTRQYLEPIFMQNSVK